MENTLAGSVVAAYDVLATNPLEIVGEVVMPIHHCVLGLPGARLDGLARGSRCRMARRPHIVHAFP